MSPDGSNICAAQSASLLPQTIVDGMFLKPSPENSRNPLGKTLRLRLDLLPSGLILQ
ncbi:hypothetical protein SBA1_190033 [Candidatus Sulfotelmatobacter kueseliae]|uniref:Uncharacterized protein n=1 Tax=Candidatus Sulfotelmatobacter kueseliae TaxID=2042962 RepID=A0A2U3KDZ8_9BACT|nr:hypothetical protein SBA1_190033 [Candidatus Sulfotelmatobacter kueseliae]